jgi:hypothetical protein
MALTAEQLLQIEENAQKRNADVIPVEGPGSSVAEPDDAYAAQSRDISEYYQSIQAEGLDKNDLLPPIERGRRAVIDVANILAHDEMATLGFKLDEEGLSHRLSTAKDMWMEHPIRSTIATGFGILPALRIMSKPFMPDKLIGMTDDVLRSTGMVDDPAVLARMSSRDKRLLQQQAYNMQNAANLKAKINDGTASFYERALHRFNETFANKYMKMTEPDQPFGQKAQYIARINNVMEGQEVHRHLANLPDDKYGTAIAQYLIDPKRINDLPNSVKPWAINMGNTLRKQQHAATKEGFISAEEAEQIGDIWFSTTRIGTPAAEMGAQNTILMRGRGGTVKQLKVPRTASPNLLARATSKQEVKGLIDRQAAAEALEAGNANKALGLLKGKDHQPYRELINDGEHGLAIQKLTEGGRIDFSPESLTMKSLMQQSLLFENYRYIRDVAINPEFTKNAQYVAQLSPKMRKQFISLDTFEGASRVRRMVGKKLGKDGPVEELGYVHKSLFDELVGPQGQGGVGGGMVDLLGVMTAMHKTSKTAFNMPTHFQNVFGNYAFLINAGFNPFTPENFSLLHKTALPAIRKMQKATRGKQPVADIGSLGTIESKAGGAAIDLADEFNSLELKEIVEMSSMLAAEGIGVMSRIAEKAKDHQTLTKKIIEYYQKGINKTGAENLSDWYMAEDGFVKAGYFLHLRQRGFSRAASAREVGRRLPMYHSIGEFQKRTRHSLLPWISFPSEAFRIFKNNLMDRPVSTIMMTHATNMAQAVMYPATGESYEGIRDTIENLPTWAQKPTTSLVTPWRDSNDDIRAAMLDFLPNSSFLPKTTADVGGRGIFQKLPFGLDQPFPILNGLYYAMTGQDAWGREIPTDPNDPTEKIGKVMANTLGFVSPPIIQKYLLNTTTPDGEGWTPYRLKQDFGSAVNPYTNKPGHALYDMFLNNTGITGAKFYPSSGEQGLANDQFVAKQLTNYRGKLTRDWNAFIKSGDHTSAAQTFSDIMMTFNQEWSDPAVAQQKANDWLKRHIRSLQKIPALRGMSKEKILEQISQMGDSVAMARSSGMAERVAALRQAYMTAGATEEGGGSVLGGGFSGGGFGGGSLGGSL